MVRRRSRRAKETSSRVVVVTGASSGIGRGVARAFAARGDDVVLAARGEQQLAAVARECTELGGRALVVPTDVSDEQAVQALVDRAVTELGRIDAWVNCAAVWSFGTFEHTPSRVFRQVVETTLLGPVHAARAVLPQYRAQGDGVLVNVASLYGWLSAPYVSGYVTAKWGLVGFGESLQHELRTTPGIAVCTVLPGTVDTPIYRHAANYVGRRIRPLPPVVPPERVVRAVVRVVDRPEPQVVVGRMQHGAARLHDLAPALYRRFAGPVVHRLALGSGPVPAHDGAVFVPDPAVSDVDDGWRAREHRIVRRALAAAVGASLAATALRRAARSTLSA